MNKTTHILNTCITIVVLNLYLFLNTSQAFSIASFLSYNDLSWGVDQIFQNISRITTDEGMGIPPDGDQGHLVDYFTGVQSPYLLQVRGGSWDGDKHTTFGQISDPGTDAHAIFNNKVDTIGVISYGTSNIRLQFHNLKPLLLYEVVVFGNRAHPHYTNRVTKATLKGATFFLNMSSSKSIFSGLRDPCTSSVNGFNTKEGVVARFSNIMPGEDGSFEVLLSDGGSSSPSKHYVNALMLREVESPYTFVKIADTETLLPESTDRFITFTEPPVIDHRSVGFTALSEMSNLGIYRYLDQLEVIADLSTPVPNTDALFGFFSELTMDDGFLSFNGQSTSGNGIYNYNDSTFKVVADTDTPVPNQNNSYTFLANPYTKNGTTVFRGFLSSLQGVYADLDGPLKTIADKNTPIPNGSGNFTGFRGLRIDEKEILFIGNGSNAQQGIYTYSNDSLEVLVNQDTPYPNGNNTFSLFGDPSFDQGEVVFAATLSSGDQAILLRSTDGTLHIIAENEVPIPGGTGTFSTFGQVSLDKSTITFLGRGEEGQLGIYQEIMGNLYKVIDIKDELEGSPLTNIAMSPGASSGRFIAFQADFNNGVQRIYRAQLHIPLYPPFFAYNDLS